MPPRPAAQLGTPADQSIVTRLFDNRSGRVIAVTRLMLAAAYYMAPPETTPQQAYRQVREYRERYPDKAVVAWHNGVTAMPALMAGAAQVLNRNPSAGHGQGRSVDRTPVDAFVQEHLADRLAAMAPANDLVADGQKAWVLADGDRRTVLVYSYEGAALTLAPAITGRPGVWFNPRDGRTVEVGQTAGVLAKPDTAAWALLLRQG